MDVLIKFDHKTKQKIDNRSLNCTLLNTLSGSNISIYVYFKENNIITVGFEHVSEGEFLDGLTKSV